PWPDLRQPRNRRQQRGRAGRQHDRVAGLHDLVAYPHAPLAVQPRLAAHERDAAPLEPRQLSRVVEMVDHLVAPDQGALDVERGLLEAHARNPLDLVHHLPGAQERLRRHAGVVGALAPHQLALDHDDVESVAGQPARAHLTGGAGSHHDGVDRSLGAHGIASTVLPAMSEADTGAAAADRPLTEGELWAREQLTALLAARFSPAAAGRFLLASQRRANDVRRARPKLGRQARRWMAGGGCAWAGLAVLGA